MLELLINPSSVLKNAVATFSLLATKAAICYSSNGLYIEAVADQGKYTDRIVAVLSIDVATAYYFRSNVVGREEIDLKVLYQALDTVNNDEWSVKVNVYSNGTKDGMVAFVFANSRIGGLKYNEMELVNADPVDIGDPIEVLAVVYRSIVGIPSIEFIRILTYFSHHGDRVKVEVTEKRVTFSSNDEKIVLKKKYQHCIIGGDAFTFSIDLGFLSLYINAATQTQIVWIHEAAEVGNPIMLNIPLGSFLGNLMLYFF